MFAEEAGVPPAPIETTVEGKLDDQVAARIDTNIHQMQQSFAKSGNAQEDFQKLFNRTAYLVIGIVALLLLTVWILRRVNLGRSVGLNRSNHIQIIERRALSQKSVLYLVQIGDKMTLLSESQLSVTQIAEFDRNMDAPDSISKSVKAPIDSQTDQ